MMSPKRITALITFVAMGLFQVFAGPVAKADETTVVSKTDGGRAAMVIEARTATVKAIDKETRTLTLQTPEGKEITIPCGKEVRNFDQIEVGDIVRAAAIDRVAVSLGGPTTQPGKMVVRAPEGAKPGMLVANTEELTANIESIDREKRIVTLKGPKGNVVSVVVGADVNLAAAKAGDDITLRTTRGIAMWVEKAQDAQPAAIKIEGDEPRAGAIESVTGVSTVTAVDADARTINIKTPSGKTETVSLGKQVVNFDQIKVGDQVRATLAESVAIAIGKPGELPRAKEGTTVLVAPKGGKPGVIIAESQDFSGKIDSVDAEKRMVTLKVDGISRTLKAGPDVDLSKLNAGDTVAVRATEALVIVVEKP